MCEISHPFFYKWPLPLVSEYLIVVRKYSDILLLVWKHFITQTDEKRWTQGKRRAEADNLVGISFLTTIQAPSILSETENAIDRSIGHFTKNMSKMDAAVRNLSTVAVDQANKYKVSTKKDYQVRILQLS